MDTSCRWLPLLQVNLWASSHWSPGATIHRNQPLELKNLDFRCEKCGACDGGGVGCSYLKLLRNSGYFLLYIYIYIEAGGCFHSINPSNKMVIPFDPYQNGGSWDHQAMALMALSQKKIHLHLRFLMILTYLNSSTCITWQLCGYPWLGP